MKTLFESLETLAEEIFCEGFADALKRDKRRMASLLSPKPSVTAGITKHIPKDVRKKMEDIQAADDEKTAKTEPTPKTSTEVKNNQPVKSTASKQPNTKAENVESAKPKANSTHKVKIKTVDKTEAPEIISTKVGRASIPADNPKPTLQTASEFRAKSSLGSPTKMAVLSYMRWAFTGFKVLGSGEFITKFRDEFSSYKRKTDAKFFYKLGTGQWAKQGVAKFDDMDYDAYMQNQRKQTLGYRSKHGPVEEMEADSLRLKFITREGSYITQSARDQRGNVDKKNVKVSEQKFILSKDIIGYVLPLPVIGGYRKSAFYIRLKDDIEVMPGVFAKEVFLMDASKFNDNTLDDNTRINNYSSMFDKFVTIVNTIALYMYRFGLNGNLDYGLAYQNAIIRIEDNLKRTNPNYQPNFTDINHTFIDEARKRQRALTIEELTREFPKIYIEKINAQNKGTV